MNPSAEYCQQIKGDEYFRPTLDSTVGVFLAQLRLLLGITDKVGAFLFLDGFLQLRITTIDIYS